MVFRFDSKNITPETYSASVYELYLFKKKKPITVTPKPMSYICLKRRNP